MRYYAPDSGRIRQTTKQPMSAAPDTGKTPRELVVEDLERRLEAMEALDDSDLGSFAGWDWVICVVGAVLIPALLLWWFA